MTDTFTVSLAGTEASYACTPGDTLLAAGLRAGLGLAYECNAGSCGSCKVELVSGELDDLYPEAPGIKQRDRDRGRRLACQSVPRGDCSIKTRLHDTYVTRYRPQRGSAVLQGTRVITHDIFEFSFRSDDVPAHFQPGQYAMLQVPGSPSPRAYSMSNNSNDQGLWQFMIRRTPQGLISNALFGLQPGTRIGFDGPYGTAYLREDGERDIVCVAGGSGIAPMVSILDAAARLEAMQGRSAWFFYGGRGPADVPQIGGLLPAHDAQRLQWQPAVSMPELADGSGWHGETGFIHELLPRKLPGSLADYEYYLAGPPPMIEATVRLLAATHKVPQSQLHYDCFF